MDFVIIDETAPLFGDSILSTERQQELSKKLDDMVKGFSPKVQLIRVCHIMQEIASFCDTVEELTFCTILHINWHQKRGQTLC